MFPNKMKQHTCVKQEQRTKCHLPMEQFWLWMVTYGHTWVCSGKGFKNNALSLFPPHTDYRGPNSLLVKQSKSVHLGGSVTFQCSLHFRNEENCDTCPVEHNVFWFRAGPGESHPSIIYTPTHSSHEQDRRRCFYTLTKTINVSDTGTYYCAVDVCGQILFGGGSTLQPSKGNVEIFFLNYFLHISAILLL